MALKAEEEENLFGQPRSYQFTHPLDRGFRVNLGLTLSSAVAGELRDRKQETTSSSASRTAFQGNRLANWVMLTNSLVMTNTAPLQMKRSPQAVQPALLTAPNGRSGTEALSKIKIFCNLMEFI